MFGLGGPISENVEKTLVFKSFFEGGQSGKSTPSLEQVVGEMVFWVRKRIRREQKESK